MLMPAIATAISVAIATASTPGAATASAPAGWERAEVARIQRHFDGALEMLARRDLAGLTADQRSRRARLVEQLRDYRDRGDFPRNRDFPGEAVPYVIDRVTGVRCAVAHLLDQAGGSGIVQRVAAADNNIWVPELAGDAEFRAWLDVNGLTLDEAARIQVPYAGEPLPEPSPVKVGGAHYAAIGSALGAAALNSIFANERPSQATAFAGAVIGVAAIGSGVSWMRPNQSREMGAASIAAGGLSFYLATRTFSQLRRQARSAASPASTERATITPIIPVGSGQGFGASLSVSF